MASLNEENKKLEISQRLKEERKRLDMNQVELAKALQVTKRSIINWEGSVSLPNAEIMAKYAFLGADVLYILTGNPAIANTTLADPKASALLYHYECSSDEDKKALEQIASSIKKATNKA